jgi:hypothetical protein
VSNECSRPYVKLSVSGTKREVGEFLLESFDGLLTDLEGMTLFLPTEVAMEIFNNVTELEGEILWDKRHVATYQLYIRGVSVEVTQENGEDRMTCKTMMHVGERRDKERLKVDDKHKIGYTYEPLTVEQIKQLPVSECSCRKCQDICHRSRPCWGTPDEIQKIIDAGHGDMLQADWYDDHTVDYKTVWILSPAAPGHEKDVAPYNPMSGCTFHGRDGLCKIHDIKPIEGRWAMACNNNTGNDPMKHHGGMAVRIVHESIAISWNTPEAQEMVRKWAEKYGVTLVEPDNDGSCNIFGL